MSKLTGAPDDPNPPEADGASGTPEIKSAIVTKLVTIAERHRISLASKESVAAAIMTWAKWRIMSNTLNKQELEGLLNAARAAGRAEGYAQAKLEIALERAGAADAAPETQETDGSDLFQAAKPENWKIRAARKAAEQENEPYKTRTTVAMTKTIALDYLRSVAPQVVGPSEIIKNTKKTQDIFISFGALKRAIDALIDAGEVEQTEPSRWRFKEPAAAVSPAALNRTRFKL